jgi:hypothetical protein
MALFWQMKPTLAEDGTEALSILEGGNARGTPFALIFVDAQMPVSRCMQMATVPPATAPSCTKYPANRSALLSSSW